MSRLSLLLPLLLPLAACSPSPAPVNPVVATSAKPAAHPPTPAAHPAGNLPAPLPTTPVDLSSLESRSVQELETLHRAAIAQGRVVAPANDNAVLYELALRERSDRAGYQGLLDGIAPDLVLRAERAIASVDAQESARAIALLEAVNPSFPALPRLRASAAAIGAIPPVATSQPPSGPIAPTAAPTAAPNPGQPASSQPGTPQPGVAPVSVAPLAAAPTATAPTPDKP